MLTDKKNALSFDSPDYIIRPKMLLLQKQGNQFFLSSQKHHHPVPEIKPTKTVITNYKFGLSKDSPFHNKYSEMHKLTPQLFRVHVEKAKKNHHFNIRQLTKQAHGSEKTFCNLLTKYQPPERYDLFKNMLNHSVSKEKCRKASFLNKEDHSILETNAKTYNCDEYLGKIKHFTSKSFYSIKPVEDSDIQKYGNKTAH